MNMRVTWKCEELYRNVRNIMLIPMSFLFLRVYCADSHSTLGRKSYENVGGTKCPESQRWTIRFSDQHNLFLPASVIPSFTKQSSISSYFQLLSIIRACLRGALSFGGKRWVRKCWILGVEEALVIWRERGTQSFTEEGVHALLMAQCQLSWGHGH